MSHSFGEGYATRCDEEGFGGIYGENQSLNTNQKDKSVHENHPGYNFDFHIAFVGVQKIEINY